MIMQIFLVIFEFFFATAIVAAIYYLCQFFAKFWLKKGRKACSYWLKAFIVMFLPWITFFILVGWHGLDPTNRICGGWMSNSYPCGWEDYLRESLFWMFMILTIPYSVWAITGCVAFYWTRKKWMNNFSAYVANFSDVLNKSR